MKHVALGTAAMARDDHGRWSISSGVGRRRVAPVERRLN
jgi:hypothetical protein